MQGPIDGGENSPQNPPPLPSLWICLGHFELQRICS